MTFHQRLSSVGLLDESYVTEPPPQEPLLQIGVANAVGLVSAVM
jgi:hypothetical protein